MRWPLRHQILLPFTVLLLGTVAMVSALDAYFSARSYRMRVQQQLRDIATTLSPGRFPLTSSVLQQTHGLSGAHFVVASRSGQVLAASDAGLTSVPAGAVAQRPDEVTLGEAIEVGGARYLHAAVQLRPMHAGAAEQRLHILYPEQTWRQAWWQNVYPPALTGGIALLLAAVFSAIIAAGVSRPITKLQSQVEQIATGDFRPLPEPGRNDEILDLVRAVNRMALTLAEYEEQLRRDERLKALGQLRGSLAHQFRNAVTGCRMALDLHRMRASAAEANSESLAVAQRQLALMERHLEQFLRFADDGDQMRFTLVDVNTIVAEILPLVQPAAQHAHVQLELNCPSEAVWVQADRAGLEQVVINLLLNAFDAIAGGASHSGEPNRDGRASLCVSMTDEHVIILVADNGPGPSDAVRDKLFEALVTDKPHGAGLGLAASQEIVRRHGGRLHWRRDDGWTRFAIELPRAEAVAVERSGAPADAPPARTAQA